MNSVFISGIPASGKTYLAKKLSVEFNLPIISIDKLRKEMSSDLELKKWVDFYSNLDEKNYYTNTSCSDQWQNLVGQSEAFWSFIKKSIDDKLKQSPHIIEGVNLLPHLVNKLSIPGVFLVGESENHILERIKKDPRWGKTEELQKVEAREFYNCEGKRYKEEAEKHGYEVFTSAEKAYDFLADLIQN